MTIVYRVLTPSGVLADGEWMRREDIPARIPDRFNNYFETAEAEIIEVTTGAPEPLVTYVP